MHKSRMEGNMREEGQYGAIRTPIWHSSDTNLSNTLPRSTTGGKGIGYLTKEGKSHLQIQQKDQGDEKSSEEGDD